MALDRVQRGNREQIRIVIADADRHLRSALRQSFLHSGFKAVQEVGTIESLKQSLEEATPDLLLVAAKLPDGDGCTLVRNLRHSKIGRNPFLSVIVTAWPEEVGDVGRLINSGTDHVVLKPVAPAAVFERMEAIIERRRPFVATATYLGPDRRTTQRPEDEAIPQFEVPNTLRLRASGEPVDLSALQLAMSESLNQVNSEMVRRQAFHMVFLVERASGMLQVGTVSWPAVIAEIALCGRDLVRRLDMELYSHVADLCGTLDNHLSAATTRCKNGPWDEQDLLVTKKLAQAVYISLHAQPDLGDLASKVTQAVSTFEIRQNRRSKVTQAPPPVIMG